MENIGHKVIIRGSDSGVEFGELIEQNGQEVTLKNARRLWYWEGANCLADVATKGIRNGKVSRAVSSMVLNRCCQIIPCEEAAINNLDNISVWSR